MNACERVTRTIEFTDPDRLPVGGNFMHYEPRGDVVYHFPRMSGHAWWEGQGGGTDEWGCRWISNRRGDMGQIRDHILKDIRGFASLPRPDGRDPARYDHLAGELAQRPDAYHVLCNGSVLFERMHFLRGFSELLMDSILDTEAWIQFADWVIAYQEQTLSYLAEHFRGRLHAFRCTDDLGMQSSTILSPALFGKLLKPFYRRIGDWCHHIGMHFWLHSCGRINGALEDLIETGVDVINPQVGVCGAKEMGNGFRGRIAFEAYPDLQTVVTTGDPTSIRADIAAQLKYMATSKGGYIAMGFDAAQLEALCNTRDTGALIGYVQHVYQELDPFCRHTGGV